MAKTKKKSHFNQQDRVKKLRDFNAYREQFKKRLRNAQGNAVMNAAAPGVSHAAGRKKQRRRPRRR